MKHERFSIFSGEDDINVSLEFIGESGSLRASGRGQHFHIPLIDRKMLDHLRRVFRGFEAEFQRQNFSTQAPIVIEVKGSQRARKRAVKERP